MLAVTDAYRKICERKVPCTITNQDLELETKSILFPNISTHDLKAGQQKITLYDRFEKYIEDGYRDGLFCLGRYRHYQVSLNELGRYLEIRNKKNISVTGFTAEHVVDYHQFLIDEYKYVPAFPILYEKIKDINIPKEKRSQNTVAMKLKQLHAFFNSLVETDEIQSTPFAYVGKKRKNLMMRESYSLPICLTHEELKQILRKSVPDNLQEVKNAFLLQCALGCRISDFKNLNMNKVSVTEDGIPYVHYLPQKTRKENLNHEEVCTPLVRYAFDIVKKTKFKFTLLNYVTGEWGYNAKIKELLKYCGIDRLCAVYDEKTSDNVYKPLYETASTKLARKTNVDIQTKAQVNMYAAGLHKEGSGAVNHYTHIGIKEHFILMCYAFKQPKYKVNDELEIMRA